MKKENVTLKSCSTDEEEVFKLEEMLKEWLPQYFEIDFQGKNFSSHSKREKLTILLMILNDKIVIGGAVLADGLSLNNFEDSAKIDKVEEYKKSSVLNFSYFYILPEYRRKGYGSKFLEIVAKKYPNTWLASGDKLLNFYKRCGYKVEIFSSDNEECCLLVSNNKRKKMLTKVESWDREVRDLWVKSYVEELSNFLKTNDIKSILDTSGGTGYPLVEFAQMGWDVTYADSSIEMSQFLK